MERSSYSTTPCPGRLLEEAGAAFGMGFIGGGIWHFVKGYRNSPKGERLSGAYAAAKLRAPVLGGNFGIWGTMFGFFDCNLSLYRQREDIWNSVISGATTGGLLSIRAGYKQIATQTFIGGALLAFIELAFGKGMPYLFPSMGVHVPMEKPLPWRFEHTLIGRFPGFLNMHKFIHEHYFPTKQPHIENHLTRPANFDQNLYAYNDGYETLVKNRKLPPRIKQSNNNNNNNNNYNYNSYSNYSYNRNNYSLHSERDRRTH